MKPSVAALAIVLTATATPALAAQAAAPATGQAATPADQPKTSPKAAAPILALQAAVNGNDTANIPAKLAAAQAVASTPGDRYWVALLQLKADVAANNTAGAQQAADALAASGATTADKMADLHSSIGGTFLSANQYDLAAREYEKASAAAPGNSDYAMLIAEARLKQGQKPQAAAALQRAIQIDKQAGRKPTEAMYHNAVGLAYEANLPTTVALAREWLSAYPSDANWKNALAIYRNRNNGDAENVIDLMRLSKLTNAMQTANDYQSYAYKAIEQANFAEAKATLDAGIAAGTIKASNADVAQLVAATRGKIPTSADLAAAERGAVAPQAFLRVGDRYYAAGNYQKAAELYRQALAKGVDANLANLRLGEALVASGDTAGAVTAFNSVQGSRADLAQFWVTYAQRRG